MSSKVLMTLHLLLLSGFVGTTSTLMLVTVINRLRVRGVVLAWRRGRLGGLPAGATAFNGLMLGLVAYYWTTEQDLQAVMGAGYLAGGAFWWAAAFLARTTLVTEYGVVARVNGCRDTFSWGQVTDYFSPRGTSHYVFFYLDDEGARCRLNLRVPPRKQASFEALVEAKVDARFDFALRKAYGPEALEE